MINMHKLFKRLTELSNQCIPMSYFFKSSIFEGENIAFVESHIPQWMQDAGASAESPISKDFFEKLLRENNNELTNKLLYYFDCLGLVDAMRERFSLVGASLEAFYSYINPNNEEYDEASIKSTVFNIDSRQAIVFSTLNSIFINIVSLLDLLYKVVYEFESHISDFSCYPKMASHDILFRKGLSSIRATMKVGNSIFAPQNSVLTRVYDIRNRLVHNGSLDISPRIYFGTTLAGENARFILFPDMGDCGFVKSTNRASFYSQGTHINKELPKIVSEFLDCIECTVDLILKEYQVSSIYDLDNAGEVFKKYENETKQWICSYANILLREKGSLCE